MWLAKIEGVSNPFFPSLGPVFVSAERDEYREEQTRNGLFVVVSLCFLQAQNKLFYLLVLVVSCVYLSGLL
jgi:hypothetical protein